MTQPDPANPTTKIEPKAIAPPPRIAPQKTPPPEPDSGGVDIFAHIAFWVQEEGPWWLCSFVFHLVLICSLALIGTTAVVAIVGDAPSFEQVDVSKEAPKEIEHFKLGDTPEDPTELNTETLTMEAGGGVTQEEEFYDNDPVFSKKGGGMTLAGNEPPLGGLGFDIKAIGSGPALAGKGGVGTSVGTGVRAGIGGDGTGFGSRGTGYRKAMLGTGGTRQSEQAVRGALYWLARHQMTDGSWSLSGYTTRCKDNTCTGPAGSGMEIAGTAFGLLPFLAAGQTHESKGPYQKNIYAGVNYLLSKQKADGSFVTSDAPPYMYQHGLASIALCECFGMTGDLRVRKAAQAALDFIAEAQDPAGGGWRYQPRMPGDTSVTGWQVMALKSGQMAGLNVSAAVLEKAHKFLESVSISENGRSAGGLFGYMSKDLQTSALNAVGLLCYEYLGVPRTDPALVEGTAYLMSHQPGSSDVPDIYYWYYATQVMHNQPGHDWDVWNRTMRRRLIDTQCRDGCALGSWDPRKDLWGGRGGRLMQTSLSALTLEVYYRYLPLYKLDKDAAPPAAAAEKPAAEKPAADKPEKESP
jgi:hypothetical protein